MTGKSRKTVVAMVLAVAFAATIVSLSEASLGAVGASAPQRLFWIADNGVYRHVACDQVATGTHSTLFTCGEPKMAPRDAEAVIHAFDHHIYPTDEKSFGSSHGADRVTIVMAPFSGMTFGYFDENDLNPMASAEAWHSNHGNILYVRALATMPDSNKMADVQEALAHEFQHLIDFRVRVIDRKLAPQQVWLNEGLSFFAQLLNGYWTSRDSLRVEASASDPAWSLTSMSESSQFLKLHGRVAYGRAGMFVTYLAAHYGARFTRDVVHNRQIGMRGIDVVLRREHHGTCAEAFARWGVAQLLNDTGRYGYAGLLEDHFTPPHLAYPTVVTYPFDTQAPGRAALALSPWTQSFVRLASMSGEPVTIRVAAAAGIRIAAVYGPSSDSNAGEVRWLKAGPGHSVLLRLGGYGQRYGTVTLAISAIGSLRAIAQNPRPASVRIWASSVDARHYQRVSRPAATAGQDAHFTF